MSAPQGVPTPRPGVEVVLPGDNRTAVSPATGSPFRWVGLLELRFPRWEGTGTGVLIDDWHVLTAAHNVFDKDDEVFATSVAFSPGCTRKIGGQVDRPFGALGVARLQVPDLYRRTGGPRPPEGGVPPDQVTKYLYDFAVLRLSRPAPDALGPSPFALGPLPPAGGFPVAGGRVLGYSGDLDPTGMTQYDRHGAVALSQDEDLVSYTMSTSSGDSGAPVFYQPADRPYQVILGVHVTGFSAPPPGPNPGPNFGPAMHTENVDVVSGLIDAVDS